MIESFNEILEFWNPKLIHKSHYTLIKIAKLKGKYIWHKNNKDQVYIIFSGMLLMDFRNGRMDKVRPGEFYIIPKGIEHLPRTNDEEEVLVILIEARKQNKHKWIEIKNSRISFKSR